MSEIKYSKRTHKGNMFKNILKITAFVLIVIIIVLLGMYRNELATLSSLKSVDQHPLYTMTYKGDYGFDEFLQIGASSDQDIEEFVIKRLLKGLNIDLKLTSAGCTVFAAENKNGERIFGRNFDFDYAPAILLTTKPNNGYESISMVNLVFAGYGKNKLPQKYSFNSFLTLAAPYLPFDGMNEKGVAIALLAVPYSEPPQDPEKITLNTTTAIRLVLDKAKNTEEAMDLLKQYNYYFSGGIDCHYLIADSKGKTVLVEFMENEVKFIEVKESYQIASNFISYNNLNIGEGADEFERYDIINQYLTDSKGIVGEDNAMDLLKQVSCNERTQWSAVYNQQTGSIRVCMSGDYKEKLQFKLTDFKD